MNVFRETPLRGGVSCDVTVVQEENGREVVVKRPLAKLNVRADWYSNPERFAVEVRALRALRELIGKGTVPAVLWVDEAEQRFAMERIDPRLRNWKTDLLSGKVDLVTAARVGELLGLMHSRSSRRADIAETFRNRIYFEELRIEPFFERAAKCNPTLADGIGLAVADLRAPGIALVHGDFSPKNLLVDGADVVMLDLEIAHFGDPRFDIAFCLSHLRLKGLRRGVDAALFENAARSFLEAYRVTGIARVLDVKLVRILGCLILARFDGASPVDYREQVDEVRAREMAAQCITFPDSAADSIL